MRNPSRPSPNPNLTQPTTPEVANTDPSLRDLETMSLGEYVKAKIAHGMGKRATAKAEKIVDARLDLVEQQEADGLPISDSEGIFRRDNRDALVTQYVTDKKNEREYKKEKRKYVLSRIGSAAMWVPGVDIIGSHIKEFNERRSVNKAVQRKYRARHGGLIGGVLREHGKNADYFNRERERLAEKKDSILKSRSEWGG
jgi:hypothetical protein